MFDNQIFQRLVEADNLTGEVVAVNSFIIEVKGLEGVCLGAKVLFEDGQCGLVREAYGDKVILFNIDSEEIALGTLAVVESDVLNVPVGKSLIGRVVSPMGKPLDSKGAIRATASSGIFNPAPGIMARSMLNEQLASGVTAVDSFFPVVLRTFRGICCWLDMFYNWVRLVIDRNSYSRRLFVTILTHVPGISHARTDKQYQQYHSTYRRFSQKLSGTLFHSPSFVLCNITATFFVEPDSLQWIQQPCHLF